MAPIPYAQASPAFPPTLPNSIPSSWTTKDPWEGFVQVEMNKEGLQLGGEESSKIRSDLGKRDSQFAKRLVELLDAPALWTSKDPLTQKMMRELPEDDKLEYKGMSAKDQLEYRQKWGNTKLEKLTEEQCQTNSWQQVDTSLGQYMSASKCFQEEGGTADDVEPTKKMLQKKIKLGPPHIKYNPDTERHDFLYYRGSHAEIFHRAWDHYQKGVVKKEGVVQKQAESSTQKKKEGVQKQAESSVPPNPKGKSRTTAQTPQTGPKPSKGKKRVGGREGGAGKRQTTTSAEKDAKACMSEFVNVQYKGNAMLTRIGSEEAWKWANSEALKEGLVAKLRGMEEALSGALSGGSAFVHRFMSTDDLGLVSDYEADELEMHYKRFCDYLAPSIEAVKAELEWLADSHSRRVGM